MEIIYGRTNDNEMKINENCKTQNVDLVTLADNN